MAVRKKGAVGGFGPFDLDATLGQTEYGGGDGLVEGSPESQSGKSGVGGPDHLVGEGMPVDEKIGVAYRSDPLDDTGTDPVTGLKTTDLK